MKVVARPDLKDTTVQPPEAEQQVSKAQTKSEVQKPLPEGDTETNSPPLENIPASTAAHDPEQERRQGTSLS